MPSPRELLDAGRLRQITFTQWVRLYLEQGYSINETARRLGVNRDTVRRAKKRFAT